MLTADFDFELPEELIAQHPAPERDQSRLLVMHRDTGILEHRRFEEFPALLQAGDLLVVNDSRVIPARLRGVAAASGGAFEILLLEENEPNDWWAMLRPGRRARPGARIALRDRQGQVTKIIATVTGLNSDGHRRLHFEAVNDLREHLDALGETPLPPYIRRAPGGAEAADRERYQTVFARQPGSVAAPTAGLHFTDAVLSALRARGVELAPVTLHVGPGTFAPVKAERPEDHVMHEERYEVSAETARAVAAARARGGRVIAAGTTALRALESAAREDGALQAGAGRTRLYARPPHNFKLVDNLLTNFHLPKSSLLMLVSAFAQPGGTDGRERVLRAYAEAVRRRYRFFSYGDAMYLA